ncbi:hypothetical protein BWI17_20850 [Betaproteobacteria bacterium GR16-43]|nr:hypothetical protein BWI17_20850 [Betaproteobacteria bacterium GR16-43]
MNPLAGLEADMALHMLVEFPLLVGAGAALAHYAPRRIDEAIAPFDRYGLAGWTLASLVAAYWMIPSALDAALGSSVVNAFKYASLLAAGFALRGSLRRSPFALEAFFVGNFTWMAATVGLVYQDADVQLCLNYLAGSQQQAGRGLVLLAVAALVGWFALRSARVMPRVPAG